MVDCNDAQHRNPYPDSIMQFRADFFGRSQGGSWFELSIDLDNQVKELGHRTQLADPSLLPDVEEKLGRGTDSAESQIVVG